MAVACVAFVGTCAALESSIAAVKHQCCETQLDDGCATLCNAADSEILVTAVPSPAPAQAGGDLAALCAPDARTSVATHIPPANHSPPLYLRHAALLI